MHWDVLISNIGLEMPDNITFDQAASICVGILPFVVPTYTPEPHGFGFTAPFKDEGGVGKYAGQPILIMAGGCSLGQYGTSRLTNNISISTETETRTQRFNLRGSPDFLLSSLLRPCIIQITCNLSALHTSWIAVYPRTH